jgi:hypothetical protein
LKRIEMRVVKGEGGDWGREGKEKCDKMHL